MERNYFQDLRSPSMDRRIKEHAELFARAFDIAQSTIAEASFYQKEGNISMASAAVNRLEAFWQDLQVRSVEVGRDIRSLRGMLQMKEPLTYD